MIELDFVLQLRGESLHPLFGELDIVSLTNECFPLPLQLLCLFSFPFQINLHQSVILLNLAQLFLFELLHVLLAHISLVPQITHLLLIAILFVSLSICMCTGTLPLFHGDVVVIACFIEFDFFHFLY